MTREEWTKCVAAAVRVAESDCQAAITQLQQLVVETQRAEHDAIGSWHTRQCLGLLSQLTERDGRLQESADYDRQLATTAQHEIQEIAVSAGYALANAALKTFRFGNAQLGEELAHRALSSSRAHTTRALSTSS